LDPALVLAGLLAIVVLAAIVYTIVTAGARRRSQRASLSAIDFARGSFARQLNSGVPLVELLRQLVEALVDTFKLDAAELWLCDGGFLRLAASEPPQQREPIPITTAEESIAANARVSSAAWARVWLPSLLDGRPERPMRIAPVSHSSRLFGLIVAERSRKGQSLAEETDETLDEVAREVGVAVNKARLDAALQLSVEQLRRQADELQASRGRLVVAADEERRRIERNLHDGAQQHLVALAIKARLVEQVAPKDPQKAQELTHQIQQDAAAALDELRALAHGIYPPLLSSSGLREALPAACRRAPLPASVEVDGVGRHAPEIESAVYFCCLEALQNAAKHAGDGAAARIRIWEDAGALRFEISDDGAGFAGRSRPEGAGLTNMRDRLGAVGGTLGVESAEGRGTQISGVVPLGAG
jgi:signal transduction histidine kinase